MSTTMSIVPSSLSKEQQHAFNKFKCGQNLFITGPGGTGKTRLISQLIQHATEKNVNIQVCAMTGCASVLLNCNARTLHSWSGIKAGNGSKTKIINDVLRNKKAVDAWKKIRILIVDEISMMSKKIFDIINEIGKVIRKSPLPFGGIQVIFTGDFYQLPPVGNRDEIETSQFCFESSEWLATFPIKNHIELKTMFRQKDPVYIDILLQIRRGELSEEYKQILRRYVKREIDPEKTNGVTPAKLFPIRAKADYVNAAMFAKLDEPEVVIPCVRKYDCKTYLDTGKCLLPESIQRGFQMTKSETELELDRLSASILSSNTLSLKKGAHVMCSFNVDVENGICNGSQGVVEGFLNGNIPIVRFSNGVTRPIELHYWQSEECPTVAIGQVPLCLAWALTIHKIQGATMAMAEIDIGNSVFEYGQTYVALSRIECMEGLYLSAFHPHRIKANPIVTQFYQSIPELTDADIAECEIAQSTSLQNAEVKGTNREGTNRFEAFVMPEITPASTSKIIRL